MNHPLSPTYTSFQGHRRMATGPLHAIALDVKRALQSDAPGAVLIFSDADGRSIDIDTRGSDEDLISRLQALDTAESGLAGQELSSDDGDSHPPPGQPRGRGRPKLGVVSREVTLLPRHWEWLAAQSGGASVALRKLVEQARRASADSDKIRLAHERAYHFMSAMAGDLNGFEEASRALFANDRPKLTELMADWPVDVRQHVLRLAFGADGQTAATTPAGA